MYIETIEQDARYVFLATLVEGSRVLHIGSENGHDLVHLAHGGAAEILTITKYLPQVATTLDQYGISNVVLRPDLPPPFDFPDDAFDFIICQDLSLRIQEQPKWHSELRRVLKPSGHLAVVADNPEGDKWAPLDKVKTPELWDYHSCVNSLQEAFGEPSVYGQIPIVASMICDMMSGSDEPDLVLDNALVAEESEDESPGWYVLIMGPALQLRDQLLLVRHPFSSVARAIKDATPEIRSDGSADTRELEHRIEKEHSNLNAQLLYTQKALAEQERLVAIQSGRIQSLDEENIKARMACRDLSHALEQSRTEKRDLREMDSTLIGTQKLADSLERQIGHQSYVIRELEQDLLREKEQHHAVSTELAISRSRQQNSLSHLQEQIASHLSDIDHLIRENAEYSEKVYSLQRALTTSEEKAKKAAEEALSINQQNDSLQKVLNDLKQRSRFLEEELAEHEEKSNRKIREHEELTKSLIKESSESNQQKVIQAQNETREALKQQGLEHQKTLREKEAALSHIQKSLEAAQVQLAHKTAQLEETEQQKDALEATWEAELEKAKEKVATVLAGVEEALEKTSQGQKNAEKRLSEVETERNALQEALQKRERDLEESEQTLANITEERDNIAHRLQELNSELFRLRAPPHPDPLESPGQGTTKSTEQQSPGAASTQQSQEQPDATTEPMSTSKAPEPPAEKAGLDKAHQN